MPPPTVVQSIALLVAEGLAWLVPVVVDGYANWAGTPWIIAGLMILVAVGWVLRVRAGARSPRGRPGGRGRSSTFAGPADTEVPRLR